MPAVRVERRLGHLWRGLRLLLPTVYFCNILCLLRPQRVDHGEAQLLQLRMVLRHHHLRGAFKHISGCEYGYTGWLQLVVKAFSP